jgi:transcriptional regulator with XRE-family HTH domain
VSPDKRSVHVIVNPMDGQPPYSPISRRRVQARMAWLGVTQLQVAEQLGLDPSILSRRLRNHSPKEDFLDELAVVLGWEDRAQILTGADELVVSPAPDWVAAPTLPLDHAAALERNGQQSMSFDEDASGV